MVNLIYVNTAIDGFGPILLLFFVSLKNFASLGNAQFLNSELTKSTIHG
jgi:hypothetical protein